MNSYIGTSGTIPCPDNLGIMVKRVHADVSNSAVTNVGITLSGVGTGESYHFNGITPVLPDIRFPYQAPVLVTSSGSLNSVVVGYVYYGDMTQHMNLNASSWAIPIPTRLR